MYGVGPLFTDLYELTMAACYFEHQIDAEATFSLYLRGCPASRNYYVAAGLENALDQLEGYSFSASDIAYLESTGLFLPRFIDFLKQFQFSGEIVALPEGTIFFPNEPILEVTAPILEAQILETFLLNTIGFATLIATKASRCVCAAAGRPLIDFSLRRTQGQDAGMQVARNTYLAGFAGTSNVLAGKHYGIPISGTMAHSYVTVFDYEKEAFTAYAQIFSDNSVFLIDTYDTLKGARHAVEVALAMQKQNKQLMGVRLDSGDMVKLSRQVRSILDESGLAAVKIFASSSFDEYKIDDVISQGACIDAFGVGTKVGVSADAPYLDIVYKLVRFNDRDIYKLSPGKINLAGSKQIFRRQDANGHMLEDIIGLRNEKIDGTEPMLERVMKKGGRILPGRSLEQIRKDVVGQLAMLDEGYKSIRSKIVFPVTISDALRARQPAS